MRRSTNESRLLALATLIVCLAAVGCGSGGSEPSDQARPASGAQPAEGEAQNGDVEARGGDGGDGGANGEDGEDGESVTSEGGSSSQSSTVTQSGSGDQSSSIQQRSGSGSTSSSSSSSSSSVKTFSGSGATTLSFNVEGPSRLVWTNSRGRPFSARGDGISIESRAGRGEVPLDARGYDGVRVRGSSWTIVVRPR